MDRIESNNQRPVAVYGATGHTGRFIVDELRTRGFAPRLVGRDAEQLAEMAARWPGTDWHVAMVDDPDALDVAFAGAVAVINAAGPFLDTAEPVIEAALRAGAHYLDTSAEQHAAQTVFDRYDAPAREVGVVVMPSVAFYGAFADLLATGAMGDWPDADAIDIAVGLDGWHPTRGTRITGERNREPRWIVADGVRQVIPDPAPTRSWSFPEPLGTQETVMLSLSETVAIVRHLRSRQVRSYMNLAPLRDLRDPGTPAPVAADERGRSAQRFVLDVTAQRDGRTRRATAQGRDIYAVTAPLVAEALERILAAPRPGAWAAGEVFDAEAFMAALSPRHFTVQWEG